MIFGGRRKLIEALPVAGGIVFHLANGAVNEKNCFLYNDIDYLYCDPQMVYSN
jgi:hypothetical protein